jgi:hypothetical protein
MSQSQAIFVTQTKLYLVINELNEIERIFLFLYSDLKFYSTDPTKV